ncbi:prepilin peptidase [uncultured Leifsonia sp.]|uniref:prepilin peptidase n=1 Tax=Leifsonia sp. TaxID=1870902 RepID=UPI0028D674E5|nr:prepilin peptidase [uncultured Leifsonia sp.]
MSAAALLGLWAAAALAAVGVFGLLIGSFLNVVAYRVPAGLSIVRPRSACPGCGARIRAWDNVPVMSWLLLRGRCRDCSQPISWRYPFVEAATGVLFIVVAVKFAPAVLGAADAATTIAAMLQLAAFLYFAGVSVALALIDLDTHTLPNAIVYPSYLVGLVLLTAAALLSGDWSAIATAVIGSAGLFALYLIIALASPRGMGFGDVKLAGVVGLFLGYLGLGPLLVGAFAAFVLGGLFGVVVRAVRPGGSRGIAFGPWMFAGAWTGVFFGSVLWQSYLALVVQG